jgi:hypothetical protein
MMQGRILALVILSAMAAFTGSTLAAPSCTATHCVSLPLITIPPPDVVVLRQNVYRGQVIGEILNTRTEPVQLITIRVDVFDSHGRLAFSDTSFEHLKTLQPTMIGCFAIAPNVPTDVGHIQIERVASTPAPGAAPRLTVIRLQQTYDGGRNAYEVFGEVQNDDTVPVAFPEVAVTLYNTAGQPIGCLADSLNNIHLLPGEASGFHLQTSLDSPNDVVGYTLQLDGRRE